MTLAAAALVFAGCTQDLKERVDSLEGRMDSAEAAIEKLKSDLSSMQTLVDALNRKLAVSDIEKTANGYVITFSDGSTATLENGKTPVVSLVEQDGTVYWAVDGDILKVNGQPVVAVGAKGDDGAPGQPGKDAPVPSFEIDAEGHLWVTVGEVKTDLGAVAGKDGDAWFSGVEKSADGLYYIITLTAGGTIELPVYVELDIVFDDVDYLVDGEVEVPFTLKGNTENAVVRAYPSKGWEAVVNASSITVTAGEDCGYVDVYLIDNTTGNIKAKSLLFVPNSAVTVTEKSYVAPAAGGNVEIPVSKEIDYTIEVSDSWLSYVETKAPVAETIVLSVPDNAGGSTRTATVSLKVNGLEVVSVTVAQKGYIPELIGQTYSESYGYSYDSNSESPTISDKGKFTITLSDDPAKGTYYIDGIYNYPYYMGLASGKFYADSEGMTLTVLAANGEHEYFQMGSYYRNLMLAVSVDYKTLSGPAVTSEMFFGTCYIYNYTATLIEPISGEGFINDLVGTYTQSWSTERSVVSASSKQDVPVTISLESETEVKIEGIFGYASNVVTATVNETARTLNIAASNISLYGPCKAIELSVAEDGTLTMTSPANGVNIAQYGSGYFYGYTLTKN